MKRILIINPFGIGDVIFSFPLIEALRAAGLAEKVDYLCNERTHELVRKNASVDRVYVFSRDAFRNGMKRGVLPGLKIFWKVFWPILKRRYDVCFDLSMGREYALVMFFAGIRKRIGFDYKNRGRFLTDKTPVEGFEGKPVRDTMLGLFELYTGHKPQDAVYPGLRPAQEESDAWQGWCKSNSAPENSAWIVFAPGGGASWGADAHYKQWPPAKFAEAVFAVGSERKLPIVIMGSAEEDALCRDVRQHSKYAECYLMTGQPLDAVLAALRRAVLFVGNDGGLLHLANLTGIPSVGIYGPVSEEVYGPLKSPGSPCSAVTGDVSCRPCYHRFKFPPCGFEKQCLEKLTLEKVLESCDRML